MKKKYKDKDCPNCNEIESFDHFISNCPETLKKKDNLIQEIINFLNQFKIKQPIWWFNNNLNKINQEIFDTNLGDLALIPNYLVEYIFNQNLTSEIKKSILIQIQILTIENIMNCWKERSEKI